MKWTPRVPDTGNKKASDIKKVGAGKCRFDFQIYRAAKRYQILRKLFRKYQIFRTGRILRIK